VSEIIPTGYHATTQTSYCIKICWEDCVTVYFGNAPNIVRKGSISGHKWLDPNGDGSYEDKTPLEGVTIELWKDGAFFKSTTTAADGSYSFADLEPGNYTVLEKSPANMVPIPPDSINVVLAEGQNVTGIDFYNRNRVCEDGVIEAVVRVDENCDGEFGWGELVDGVTIRLYLVEENGDLTPVTPPSKITGPGSGLWVILPGWVIPVDYPGGHVIWNGLTRAYAGKEEATYRIVMEPPEGYTVVGPSSYNMTLHNCPWPCFWGWFEFRLARTFHINGHKYEDKNCNGVIDAGDTGVPGVEVKLFKWNEGSDTYEYVKSTTTGANGYYEFTGLEDGVYKVQEVLTPALLEDWYIVSPAGGVFEGLEVGCGDSFDNLDFLNARYGGISGHKYEDKNCNGTIDPADTGVPGVEVKLFKWNEGSDTYEYVKSTTTGANGYYEFTGLLPGTYKVQEVLTAELLEDWYIVSPAGGVYEGIAVSCGSSIENKDFLNARYGGIEGWKYWDKDENGIMDGDDEGLAGVTIILTPEDGPPQTAVTDENGHFFFDKLLPGKYTVSVDESTAPDYYPISATSIEVQVTCGKTEKVYFSEAPYGSISGKKWLDADFDGVWGEDETVVIEGITIKLYAGNPPQELIGTKVTDKDGYYEFTGLQPGTYTVVEEGKEGYFSCTPDSVLVELSAGEGAVVDFGNCPYGRIEGLKFLDLDGDGAQDPGEPTLEGVEITLVGLGDVGAMAVATTGKDGTFVFKNLLPGEYSVEEKVPSGYYATRPIKVEVVVGPGESVSVIFANALYGSIIGNKWLDDGDSQLDPTKDKPKAGMTIKLTGKSIGGETVSMQTTTAQDGSYSFLLLEAGSYNVTEVYDPQKMKAISPDSVDVTLAPGGKAIVDFLNVETEVGGEVVTPPSGETLPTTGMDQLPLLIAAAILVVIGLAFLAFGLRRRYQE
jgi:LPXTG-motif cell wall-anchored protein